MRMEAVWSGKKILFVTGKGGVGKSLIAAGIAREQAQAGRKVLLVEVGENSYYKDFWRLPEVGHEPKQVPGQGFDLALWSGESCLREYVLYYLKLEQVYKLFFENKVMRSLINVAPGLSEIAILGKITSGIRKVGPPLNYDLIVVDTFATGHALALFRAPKGMMEAIRLGPMGHHSRDILAVLQNSALTSYVLVSLLEELPVVETVEFQDSLKRELGVEAEIIANKVLETPVTNNALKNVEAELGQKGMSEFVSYLRGLTDRQAKLLSQLKTASTRVLSVPLFFSDQPNVLVDRAAEAVSR